MDREVCPYFALDLKRQSVQVCVPIEKRTYFVTIEGIVKKDENLPTEEELGQIQWAIESMQDPEMLQFFHTHNSLEQPR